MSVVMQHRVVPEVRRVGVVRATQIGDLVFSLPALTALDAAYPDAELVLLGRAMHAELFAGRPGPVDRVVVVPPIPGVGVEPGTPCDTSRVDAFVAEMREQRFDILLQMHGGGGHSNTLVRRIGARVTAGTRSAEAEPLDRCVPFVYWQHEYFRCLELAGLVGATAASVEPQLAVTRDDLVASLRVLPDDTAPLVVIHPGATDPRRRWPVQRFAAVGDALVSAGCRVAVVGAAQDAALARDVQSAMRRPCAMLGGALSLPALVGLLSRAVLHVGNDSGPLHLAVAVGTSTVGVFWCGNLVTGGPLRRARHRPILSWRLECPVCGVNTLLRRCSHDQTFVDDVAVEEVLAAAFDLLDGEEQAGPPAWSFAAPEASPAASWR